MKRVVLFILTNLAIVAVLSIVLNILGANKLFSHGGALNIGNLLIFAFVFGMGGALISLAISKWMAKTMTGAEVIEQPRSPDEAWLLETVKRQAQQAGIGMPEVAIYESPEVNAFATGMNRNNALVAVSRGLLQGMTEGEVEAVLAHEVSHIANGDMVTLTLIQGVVNTFVIFFSKIIGNFVDKVIFKNEEGPGIAYYVTSFIAEIFLGILASIIVLWFSRQREFRADAGSANLVGPRKMIAALQRLQVMQTGELPPQIAAFGIAGKKEGFMSLFMSHPPLEDRIAALQELR